jgi:carbon storage regulator
MLVLSRQQDESIIIDSKIKVTVVDIRGDKVRIGVDAPDELTVDREELAKLCKRKLKDAHCTLKGGHEGPCRTESGKQFEINYDPSQFEHANHQIESIGIFEPKWVSVSNYKWVCKSGRVEVTFDTFTRVLIINIRLVLPQPLKVGGQ